jgi:hypothetical protein
MVAGAIGQLVWAVQRLVHGCHAVHQQKQIDKYYKSPEQATQEAWDRWHTSSGPDGKRFVLVRQPRT